MAKHGAEHPAAEMIAGLNPRVEPLVTLAHSSGVTVAVWGVGGKHLTRDREVLALLPGIQCLALTKEGMPRHPLYLRKRLRPIPLVA